MPRAGRDAGTMRQLDAAIAALRTIVSIVASADALVHLSDEVRLLSLRVERLKGTDGSDSMPAPDQSVPARGRTAGALKAIRGTLGPKILQPFMRRSPPLDRSEQEAAASNARGNRRAGRPVSMFDARPLLLVSGTATVLVAVFITAMTMFEAAQPRVHVPAAAGARKIVARQAPSFLISPVPIGSQSLGPASRDRAREAPAGIDALDQRRELRAAGR